MKESSTIARSAGWTIERIVPALAGVMVIVSSLLALTVSDWWLALTLFAGANLLLYSAVGWCPATLALRALGVRQATCATSGQTAPR